MKIDLEISSSRNKIKTIKHQSEASCAPLHGLPCVMVSMHVNLELETSWKLLYIVFVDVKGSQKFCDTYIGPATVPRAKSSLGRLIYNAFLVQPITAREIAERIIAN